MRILHTLKHTATRLFILSVCSASLLSCAKLSHNGDLDGKWFLLEMHSKPSEQAPHYTEFQDKKGEGIYWIFQLNVLNIRTMIYAENPLSTDIIARFHHADRFLNVGPTYVHFRERDSLLTDPNITLLEPIGIRGNASTYRVEELNSSRMVLCSPRDSLIFKKI